MFDNIFKNASNQLEKQCSSSEYDYIENELLHCGICKTPKQTRIKFQTLDEVFVCICKCEVEADKLEQEKMRKQQISREINHLRETGIPCKNMRNWTFET